MMAAQVMGNDTTITVAAASGNFQLNVMLPVIAYNLLQSVELLGIGSRNLADRAVAEFTVNLRPLGGGVGAQPHFGHGPQSRHRLRTWRGHRQESLR